MNPHVILWIVSICYIVIFGGLSIIRREGLSGQFAVEVLSFTALVEVVSLLTNIMVPPILFLIFAYLISMRGRLMADLASFLSERGRQKDAISLLQLALRLFPDRTTRLVVLVNMGIVQLRRKNPESAQSLFESVITEVEEGGLGLKYESACHYNYALALQKLGKEAQAVNHYNQAISLFPNSIYGRAAEAALEKRKREKRGITELPSDEE